MNKYDSDVEMLSPSENHSFPPDDDSTADGWNGFCYDSLSERFYNLNHNALKPPALQPLPAYFHPFFETASSSQRPNILSELLSEREQCSFSTGLETFDTEAILQATSVTAPHRTYRRFRKYDLIRYKLESSPLTVAPGVPEKVRFKPTAQVQVFSEENVVSEIKLNKWTVGSSVLKTVPNFEVTNHVPKFVFQRFSGAEKLSKCLHLAQLKAVRSEPLGQDELNELVNLGRKQMKHSVHNIIVSFEGVSSIGKSLIAVVNRLQATTSRTSVIKGTQVPDSSLSQSIRHSLVDCESLHSDILLLKETISINQELLSSHSTEIVEDVVSSFEVFDQIKVLVTTIYQREKKTMFFDRFCFSACTQYSKYTHFLNEQSPDVLLQYLLSDLEKMKADSRSLEAICQVLMSHNKMAYESAVRYHASL